MKTIVIAHQKGGVGKSTLTVNIANSLYLEKNNIAIIDIDEQGTTTRTLQNLEIDLYSTLTEFRLSKKEYDYLIIDTPPFNMMGYDEVFKIADLLIVPTQPTIADVIEVENTLNYYFLSDHKKSMIVINRTKPRVNYKAVIQQLNRIKGEAEIAQTQIADRVSFSNSLLEDNAVFSTKDLLAQNEIKQLTKEIKNLIN